MSCSPWRAVSGDPLTDPVALDLLLRVDAYRTLPMQGVRAAHITGVLTDLRVAWRGIVKYAARTAASAAATSTLALELTEEGSHWAPADAETARRWPHERYAFAIARLNGQA